MIKYISANHVGKRWKIMNPLLQNLSIACHRPLNVKSSHGQLLENLVTNFKHNALTDIDPQSHSSPSSTKPLPHSGGSRSCRTKSEIKGHVSPKEISVTLFPYNMFYIARTTNGLIETQYRTQGEADYKQNRWNVQTKQHLTQQLCSYMEYSAMEWHFHSRFSLGRSHSQKEKVWQ